MSSCGAGSSWLSVGCLSQKADIWSCGVILYAMLFGKYPFDAQQRNFARHIVNAQYSIPQVCTTA